MTDLTASVSLSGIVDIKYDDSRGLLYLSTTSGTFYRWDLATESFDASVSLPGPSAGFDITPDGQYALVGKGYAPGDSASQIERINLSTLGVETLGFPSTGAGMDLGLFRIAIAGNGTALATAQAPNQSGINPLREFSSEGNPLAATGVTGFTSVQISPLVFANAYLAASEHGRYVLIQEGENSGDPLELYDSVANTIVAHTSGYSSSGAVNQGKADVSEGAGLVVNAIGGSAYVFDLNLHLTHILTASTGAFVGAHFSADGNQLFLWNSVANHIDAYDTHTWQEVAAFSSVVSVSNNPVGDTGEMAVSADGRMLFLITGGDWTSGASTTTGFVAIDLTAREQLGGDFPATTTVISSPYVVAAGQNLTFRAASYVPIYALDGTTNSTFTDQGTIQINSSDANAVVKAFGNAAYGTFANSLIKIAVGGSLTINATGAGSSAYGYAAGSSLSAPFENDGVFQMSAVQTAVGAQLPGGFYSTSPLFTNTGQFTVSAATATAVQSGFGTSENSGTITVTGTTSAIGFDMGYFEGGSITNSGTLTVTASAGTAYGVKTGGLGETFSVTNTGTITAQHAIYEANSSSPAQTPILHLNNSGTINGDIVLGPGPGISSGGPGQSAGAQIHNTGAINGAIYLDANGNDLYDGRGGTQTGGIYLGGGTETVYLGNDGEAVYSGAGAAHVTGGTGADTFTGGAANDFVDGGGGNDVLDGGGGVNTLSFASATTGVTVSLALQGQAQTTGVGSATLSNFQNLIGSAFADHLTGDSHDNVIDGGGGDDVIDGGGGTNTISFASAATGVTVSLALQGSAQATGVGSVTLSNFQNLTGSAFADHLTGDAGNNVIDGGGGDDVLDGGGGTNTLSFASATTGVTVSLALQGQAQNAGVGSVTATNFQNLTGSAFADQLTGDAGNNVIDGGGGNDVLDGGGGINTLSFASATTGVTVSLALQGQAQNTGVGSVTATNFQNLIGSAFNDTLQGDSGNNVLTGGAGADTFVVTPNGGADTVTDFSDAQGDKIDVSGFYKFTSLSQVLALATQSNADTVINFGGGATLTLQNVTLANLTAADFALTTGPINVGVGTVTTDPALNLSITSGPLVAFTANSGGTLVNKGTLALTAGSSFTGVTSYVEPDPSAVFENDGTFSVTGVTPIGVNFVTTRNTGSFTVTGTSALYQAEGAVGDVVNSGSMIVQGSGSAFGIDDWNSWNNGGVVQSLTTGTLGVTSSTGSATGVALVYGHDFENAGQITVSAATTGLGVSYGAMGSANTILNSGTITVSGATSTGIAVGTEYGVASISLQNSGTITAQVAIRYFATAANITNTGTINGDVYLGTGAGSVLDSHLGTINGVVNLSGGSSAVTLGAEANTVAIAGGVNVVDGGGGTNTVSYASASVGVHASLDFLGVAQFTGVSTDTLTNFQALVGSSFGDLLSASSGTSTLTGGAGADMFRAPLDIGTATVTDFSDAQGDKIDLTAFSGLRSFADVQAIAHQVNADTVLTLGSGSMTLTGVTLSSLTATDFLFPSANHQSLDITGDHKADLIFRDPATGDWGYAAMNGGSSFTWHDIGASTPSYSIDGTGDFNGDGIGDLIFRNHATGDWGIADMNTSGGYVWHDMAISTPSYSIDGTGDFNGDGTSDIIFRNHVTGDWGVALMHPNGTYTWDPLPISTPSYAIAGTGDFNGDGTSDILFRNSATGEWGYAAMNKQGGYTWDDIGPTTASYSIDGTGDFNGDGTADVIFRNNTTGDWGYAAMNKQGGYTWVYMGPSTPSYAIVGTGDFNGDGVSDILFRNPATGDWGYAAMHPNATFTWVDMGVSTPAYFIA